MNIKNFFWAKIILKIIGSVTKGRFLFFSASLTLVILLIPSSLDSSSPYFTLERLLKKSHEAYVRIHHCEVVLNTTVEFPGSDPGKRMIRYRFGQNNQVVIEIGNIMRIVAIGKKLFVERREVNDRYLVVPYDGNLAHTLASVRGRSILAGLWEPPQAVLRAGSSIQSFIHSLRFSNLLKELKFSKIICMPDSLIEVQLQAANGSCQARFDPNSFFLVGVEYLIRPSGAPKGYVVQVKGNYVTKNIDKIDKMFSFDDRGRRAVKKLAELSAQKPGISKPGEMVITPTELAKRMITLEELARALREKRVLLIGEDHLYNEPPLYACKLLEKMGSKSISLLMELPNDIQPEIDRFMKEGSESLLKSIFFGRRILQLNSLLRWGFRNRANMTAVLAVDEPFYEILFRRSYAEDSRNQTMARAIVRSWKSNPESLIVMYAGQLHMMKSGRYRSDRPDRDTAGLRLRRLGIPKAQIATVMLNGGKNFHLHRIWHQPGVLPVNDMDIQIPIPYFIDYPIFGVTHASDIFDYFVNLGSLTRVKLE
jgi:hypothetical protein